MTTSDESAATAAPFSQIPGRPSFRAANLNAIAMIPLLSTDRDAGVELDSHSARSFHMLLSSLRRYARMKKQNAMSPRNNNDNNKSFELDDVDFSENDMQVDSSNNNVMLVIPHSQLTRPGDWRYDSTPLRSFHWSNGCQRMICFDGRPTCGRMAHDRLLNASVGRDWIDLVPNRRTAAVVGILNIKDCISESDLDKAEHELQQWAQRYSAPPYEVTAHGRSFARDEVVTRLFIFDSFDEECQKRIDLSSTNSRSDMVAFPPSDDAHHQMMDLHLNIVLNDLAVAIFRQLETKIRESDNTGKDKGAAGRKNTRKPGTDEPVNTKAMSITQIASVVNADNELAIADDKQQGGPGKKARTAIKSMTESAGRLMPHRKQTAQPQLLTPLDDVWDYSELSQKDADAFKKRDVGRREKMAADLSLLAGSPIDAYERYTKAAELTKASHDPLWYAASLEGCAASFVAMAEAGGHCVDSYLESNFQLDSDMMVLANAAKDDKTSKTALAVDKTKTTLPAAVRALCEEALSIFSRHPKLAPFHAELVLKLAWYTAEVEESHLRCRWGEQDGCYSGESGEAPRWERTSVAHAESLSKSREGKELLSANTMTRLKNWSELLHRAASTGGLDPRTRADVAAACARLCLTGMRATHWGPPRRLCLHRKAAFFTVVSAEALSQCGESDDVNADGLWLAACQAYTRTGNSFKEGSHYGWATLRACTLHALSQQRDYFSSDAAAELLLALLGKISPEETKDAAMLDRINSSDSSMEIKEDSQHSLGAVGEGQPIVEADISQTVASAFAKRTSLASRNFFSTEAKSSLLTVAQSKWTNDEPIPPVPLPLVDPNHIVALASGRSNNSMETLDASLSRSLISLNCVLPRVQPYSCGVAQKRCIELISDIRQELPTISSASDDLERETFPIYGERDKPLPPPLHIVTAKAVKIDSHLLLERSKALGFAGKATGAMATFFNPYDSKQQEAKKNEPSLVAEGEERSVLIEFGSHLSVPLHIPSCELEFESHDKDRINAPPLSFTLPPMSKKYAVRFPFIVMTGGKGEEPDESSGEEATEPDIFEATGIRITCLNRSFVIPIVPPLEDEVTEENLDELQVPEPASVYTRSAHNLPNKPEERMNPRFEAVPPQPHLIVSFTSSNTPIEDGTIVPVHLSDGEIYSIPDIRLHNDFGPSGMGSMERLQILGVGLPGFADEMLFDSDEKAVQQDDDDDDDDDVVSTSSSSGGFDQLMEHDGLPPLRMKAIYDGLSLKSVNDEKGSTVKFQIAATHDMGNQLADGGNVRIRFRYRGKSLNPATEIWRKREVSLRIIRVKGPRISSLTFRSDLSWGSAYSELCQALAQQRLQVAPITKREFTKENRMASDISEKFVDTDEEIPIAERVGIDPGVHVSGNDVVVLMAVANETNSTIILSNRLGLVGGFEGSPMPTVRVTSGVSVKIPVVIPRIDRVKSDDSSVDIASELIARTALQWESVVDEEQDGFAGNRQKRQGRVRIPSRCLREIIDEHQTFIPRICKPPVSVKVRVTAGKAFEDHLVVTPGTPVDTFMEVENADWVPLEVIAKCRITLEFCCARTGNTAGNIDSANEDQFLWFGRVRRSVRADEEDKKHRARLTFLECGPYVVSACARVTMDGSEAEETWWAPQAEHVMVEKLNFEDSFRSLH